MFKNKLYLIIAAVVVVLLVAGGAFYFLSQKKTTQTPAAYDQQEQVLTLSPSDVGLTSAFRSDGKAMKFTLSKASDIKAIEYQISYTKEINGEQVPDGLIGEVDMSTSGSSAGISYREFGTCSSGVCRYDTVISDITLTLKITKDDGKVYQVTDTIKRPQ